MKTDYFSKISLKHWRQFEEIELDLNPNLCILTGPNGCGKTTILNVLGRHFGWEIQFLTASFLSNKEKKRFYADAWEALENKALGANEVGRIQYSSGATSRLLTQVQEHPQYNLIHENQQNVTGLHIPSHRPPPSHHPIHQIPINPKASQQHYQEYQNFLFATYGQHSSRNPASAMKETMIAFAIFGEGNASVQANEEYRDIFHGFQFILKSLLPSTVGFESIEVRAPDVILKTQSGDFPLETLSGGLNALFSIAWQIHTYGHDKKSCTVLIDEPENHLHPSMQREFLPRLAKSFPSYKFIVASHSPFVVSSHPEAAVYALTYNDRRRVVSNRLEETDLTGTPNKILREILDVQVTMPLWVEERIASIINKFAGKNVNRDIIQQIRTELESQGLGDALGDFLIQRTEDTEAQKS